MRPILCAHRRGIDVWCGCFSVAYYESKVCVDWINLRGVRPDRKRYPPPISIALSGGKICIMSKLA